MSVFQICLWYVEKNSWEVINGRYSIYWFYGEHGSEILTERLTNRNLECEDEDDEVNNAHSDESGTDDIYHGNVCAIYK